MCLPHWYHTNYLQHYWGFSGVYWSRDYRVAKHIYFKMSLMMMIPTGYSLPSTFKSKQKLFIWRGMQSLFIRALFLIAFFSHYGPFIAFFGLLSNFIAHAAPYLFPWQSLSLVHFSLYFHSFAFPSHVLHLSAPLHVQVHTDTSSNKHTCTKTQMLMYLYVHQHHWSSCYNPKYTQKLYNHTHLFCVLVRVLQGRFCTFLAVRKEEDRRTDIASAGPRYSYNIQMQGEFDSGLRRTITCSTLVRVRHRETQSVRHWGDKEEEGNWKTIGENGRTITSIIKTDMSVFVDTNPNKETAWILILFIVKFYEFNTVTCMCVSAGQVWSQVWVFVCVIFNTETSFLMLKYETICLFWSDYCQCAL